MRIVYLIQHTCNAAGMERVLCNKVNWLVEHHGYQIHIVTTDQKGRKPFFDFAPQITHTDLGINYEDNNDKGILRKTISYLCKQRLHRKKLTKLLKTLKADIVISMFGPEVSFLYKIKDSSAKILEIHFSKFFRRQRARKGLIGFSDKIRSLQDEKHVCRYDRFVVLTHEDKTYWGNHPNIEVIHNASTFIPSAQAALDNKRVISVGRLTHQKGFDMLVEAWGLVHARHPDWHLTIVGGGEEQQQRQTQIHALGLSDVIQLIPPTQQIEKEYLDSSIYALSSRYEGFGMVLVEAMACGVPSVAFACKCGPRDIITSEENGILITPGDIPALANGICRLIEDHTLRTEMGIKAAESIRTNFNQEKIMGQWVALFDKLSRE